MPPSARAIRARDRVHIIEAMPPRPSRLSSVLTPVLPAPPSCSALSTAAGLAPCTTMAISTATALAASMAGSAATFSRIRPIITTKGSRHSRPMA